MTNLRIGNDMSSRSIEGENPLYLPQAKVYHRSVSLGPCLYVPNKPIDTNTQIEIEIKRKGNVIYNDKVGISKIKRDFNELIDYLFRENSFPSGVYLMSGTCLVPESNFTLEIDDKISISITGIGTLCNRVSIN